MVDPTMKNKLTLYKYTLYKYPCLAGVFTPLTEFFCSCMSGVFTPFKEFVCPCIYCSRIFTPLKEFVCSCIAVVFTPFKEFVCPQICMISLRTHSLAVPIPPTSATAVRLWQLVLQASRPLLGTQEDAQYASHSIFILRRR